MSEFKFYCPRCEQRLQCEEQFSGREIQCPKCNVMLRIPPVPGKTAHYKPESGKTWATYITSGEVAAPKGISLQPKTPPNDPNKKPYRS